MITGNLFNNISTHVREYKTVLDSGSHSMDSGFLVLGPVSPSPGNFSGPESCFVFVLFAFNVKVSIILKMIQ